MLTDNNVVTTRSLDEEDDDESRSSRWGSARIDAHTRLVLRLMHSGREFIFNPLLIESITLGRADPASGEYPMIDLGHHEGESLGVSRRHIQISRTANNSLMVQDVGSANGTFLNGERLTPFQPRILRDGDELRVARMVIHIAFVTDRP